MELDIIEKVKVSVKTLKVHMKVTDKFAATLEDTEGDLIHQVYNSPIPDFFPEDHFGDYPILDIDIETGQITNWKENLEAADIQGWINGEEED